MFLKMEERKYCLYDFSIFENSRYIGVRFPLGTFINWALGAGIYFLNWLQSYLIQTAELELNKIFCFCC